MINAPIPSDGYSIHRIYSTDIDPNLGTVTVVVGSYIGEHIKPLKIKTLRIYFGYWAPELYETIESKVNSHPEWLGIENSPNDFSYWDYSTSKWVDIRSIDIIKEEKWKQIKLSRSEALFAPLITPFGTFDATMTAQKSITDAILLLQTLQQLGTPTTIDFTLADNTTTTLTTEQLVQVGILLGQRTQEIYSHGRILRNMIDMATTATEVENITWQSV